MVTALELKAMASSSAVKFIRFIVAMSACALTKLLTGNGSLLICWNSRVFEELREIPSSLKKLSPISTKATGGGRFGAAALAVSTGARYARILPCTIRPVLLRCPFSSLSEPDIIAAEREGQPPVIVQEINRAARRLYPRQVELYHQALSPNRRYW